MMSLKKIRLPDGTWHWSLVCGRREDLAYVLAASYISYQATHSSSDLYVDEAGQVLLKAPRVRSRLVDNLSKLVWLTPACKEARGVRILDGLNLRTRETLAVATPLNPCGPYRSFLYCRYVAEATPLNVYLMENPDAADRQALLDAVARQMATMIHNGIVFRDFYFGNVLLISGRDLCWIDTEVRRYLVLKGRARNRFLERVQRMHQRFLKHGGKDCEWPRFSRILFDKG